MRRSATGSAHKGLTPCWGSRSDRPLSIREPEHRSAQPSGLTGGTMLRTRRPLVGAGAGTPFGTNPAPKGRRMASMRRAVRTHIGQTGQPPVTSGEGGEQVISVRYRGRDELSLSKSPKSTSLLTFPVLISPYPPAKRSGSPVLRGLDGSPRTQPGAYARHRPHRRRAPGRQPSQRGGEEAWSWGGTSSSLTSHRRRRYDFRARTRGAARCPSSWSV